ncbi:MAG: 50S ribosomal protein L15 [Deltaproteobacteria bacterium]|nr:50S ribosomal protein L15 [Deltaproteobacteria bacterium]
MPGILDQLKPPPGAVRDRKRIGRGPGSGTGKTAAKGHKGAGARTGSVNKAGFEGGQMPLQRRLPKRGFTNIFKRKVQVVNVGDLAGFASESIVDATALEQSGLIRSAAGAVKVLGDGEIKNAITVKVQAISAKARGKIESAGGTVETI